MKSTMEEIFGDDNIFTKGISENEEDFKNRNIPDFNFNRTFLPIY